MANGGAREIAAKNLRCARISDVCKQVKHSQNSIPNEVIIQSFKTCKISNSLDELESEDIDETTSKSDKKNEKKFEIEMQVVSNQFIFDLFVLITTFYYIVFYRDEVINLEDDPLFEVKLNLSMYRSSEFVNFDESGLKFI